MPRNRSRACPGTRHGEVRFDVASLSRVPRTHGGDESMSVPIMLCQDLRHPPPVVDPLVAGLSVHRDPAMARVIAESLSMPPGARRVDYEYDSSGCPRRIAARVRSGDVVVIEVEGDAGRIERVRRLRYGTAGRPVTVLDRELFYDRDTRLVMQRVRERKEPTETDSEVLYETTYEYDSYGRLVAAENPREAFAYDHAGRLVYRRLHTGIAREFVYRYDERGRLIRWMQRVDTDHVQTVEIEYAPDGFAVYWTSEEIERQLVQRFVRGGMPVGDDALCMRWEMDREGNPLRCLFRLSRAWLAFDVGAWLPWLAMGEPSDKAPAHGRWRRHPDGVSELLTVRIDDTIVYEAEIRRAFDGRPLFEIRTPAARALPPEHT